MFPLLTLISFSTLLTQLKFAAAGLIATGVNYATLFLLLGLLGVESVLAAAAAFCVSTGVNFFLQKFWTYRAQYSPRLGAQIGAYAVMMLILFGLNNGLFYLLSNGAHLNYIVSEGVVTIAVGVAGYFLTRFIFLSPVLASQSVRIDE